MPRGAEAFISTPSQRSLIVLHHRFADTWETLDSSGSGLINVHQLTSLLEAVPAPLGVRGLDFAPKRVMDMLMQVDVPMHNLRVHFIETLHALAGRVAGAELPEAAEYTIHNQLVRQLPKVITTCGVNLKCARCAPRWPAC